MTAAALVLMAGTATAQATYTASNGDEYEFRPHWFLGLQGGAQYTLGEAGFGDLISPNAQLSLGYQFNPVIGLRLQANAWQSKGGWNGYDDGSVSATTTTFKYNYVAPGLDLMFNLSNLLCGWNPMRVLNVSAFLGAGANIAWGNDDANSLAKQGYNLRYLWDGTKVRPFGRGGVAVDFRLSDAVSLGVEGNANILSDKYNSKKAGNADWYFNALVGLRINLGKTYTKKEAPAPARPVEEYVQPAPAPAPAPVVEEKKEDKVECNVFFVINSTKITEAEEAKVKTLVDYLNRHADAKVEITGYADAGTGTDAINDRLAAQRAAAVKDMLTGKYGISESRISTDSKGSRVQPFADNDMNRVSICVADY